MPLVREYWLYAVIAAVALLAAWLVVRGRRKRVRLDDVEATLPRATLRRADKPARELTPPTPGFTPLAMPDDRPGSPEGDDLLLLKGVGPRLATILSGLAVTRFEQIAGWSEADIDRIDAQLGSFSGRIRRDRWVEQAALLAQNDKAGFERAFGKLDGGLA